MVFYHNCLLVQGKKSHPCGAINSYLGPFGSSLSCPDKTSKWILESNSSLSAHFPFDFLDFFSFRSRDEKKPNSGRSSADFTTLP